MKIGQILYSHRFAKKLSQFSPKEKKKILKMVRLFWQNPLTVSLKTHKLSGKLKDCWSFSITNALRIMFRFADSQTVEFIDIGTHEIYK